LFALWQELHPGVWVEPFMETEGRTGANLGTYDVKSRKYLPLYPHVADADVSVALLPFWKDGGTAEKPLKFWTSADEGIRDWTKLNYTYPDFIGLPQDAQERQLRLNGVINSDYGRDVLAWQNRLRLRLPPLVPAPRIEATVADHPTFLRSEPFTMQTQFEETVVNSKVSANRAAMQMATPHPHKRMATAKDMQESKEMVHADGPVVAEPVAAFGQQSSSTDRQPGALRNSFIDWRIRVRAARFALNMGYTVLLFLGIPSEDVAEWRTDPNLVGMHSAFTNMSAPKCENCVDQADAMDISINNITLPLIDRGQDIDDVEQIKQYVETNLHWRIQKVDGHTMMFEKPRLTQNFP
jgi:tyrosinase